MSKSELLVKVLNRPFLFALLFIGTLGTEATAGPFLSQCAEQLNELKRTYFTTKEPVLKQRTLGQTLHLTERASALAVGNPHPDIRRCIYGGNQLVSQLAQARAPDPQRTAVAAQLRATSQGSGKALNWPFNECGVDQQPLPLNKQTIARQLGRNISEHCRIRLWSHYQNRGFPDSAAPLEKLISVQHQRAVQLGFRHHGDQQLSDSPLKSVESAQAFLASLTADDGRLPWHLPKQARLSTSPAQVAEDALRLVVNFYGLELKPIESTETNFWQVWDQQQLLGYLRLEPGQKQQRVVYQGHWTGFSKASVTLLYRDKPWRESHWPKWLGLISETLAQMKARELGELKRIGEESGIKLHLAKAIGQELGRDPSLQRIHFNRLLSTYPRYPAWSLFGAEMALALSTQSQLSNDLLLSKATDAFYRHYALPYPEGLIPWFSNSTWTTEGASLITWWWSVKQAQILVDKWRSKQISGHAIWANSLTQTY